MKDNPNKTYVPNPNDKIQVKVLADVKRANNHWKKGKVPGDYDIFLYRTNKLPNQPKLLYHFFSTDYNGANLISVDANNLLSIKELEKNRDIYDTILKVIKGKKTPKMLMEILKKK